MTKLFYIVLFLFATNAVVAESTPPSPFNDLAAAEDSVDQGYAFLVSGHLYGGAGPHNGFPAATLLANLDHLNDDYDFRFFVCLGDLFQSIRDDHGNYEKALFSKLKMPLYNAVGNHDLSGTYYQDNFGATWFAFDYSGDRFIFLDAESDDSNIEGDQLQWFQEQLKTLPSQANVFIFTHRPIWAEEDEVLSKIFADNTQSTFGSNFQDDVYPLLAAVEANHNIYWMSGSLGTAPASYFYHPIEGTNIHYIQTAIRDLPRDGVLRVFVNKDGEVAFFPRSLTINNPMSLEKHTVDFWQDDAVDEGFNYRLIPYLVKEMAKHRYFWYGVGYGAGFLLFLIAFQKFRKRRKRS